MTFITPELLTCLGMAFAIGLSMNGSSSASAVSGAYITRYIHSVPPSSVSSTTTVTTTTSLGNFVKPFIPIIISGVLAIYGFIIAILLGMKYQSMDNSTTSPPVDVTTGYKYLAAGLSVGLACSASGSGLHDFLNDYVMVYASPYGFMNHGAVLRNSSSSNNNNHHLHHSIDGENTNVSSSSSLVEPLLSGQDKTTPTMLQQAFPEPNLHFCMTLVYLEAIGLYGFIVALALISM